MPVPPARVAGTTVKDADKLPKDLVADGKHTRRGGEKVSAAVTAGEDCVKEVSMVKAYCGELVNKVLYDCQQFHGGFGYVRECAVERMVRDARVQAIGGGATEVMLEEVAKRV